MLTRDEAIPKPRNIVVALITRTVRGIEAEVQLDASDGTPANARSASTTCRTVPKALLVEPITELRADKMAEAYRTLEAASGCG